MIDSGTVYHFWLPTLIDGFDDIAEHVAWHGFVLLERRLRASATAILLDRASDQPAEGADYSQSKN